MSPGQRVLDPVALQQWLKPLDALALECDGLSRAVSVLMRRDGIEHSVVSGSLDVAGYAPIPLHLWVELPQGLICDFRIRMWTAEVETVPHGVFSPRPELTYTPRAAVVVGSSPVMFEILVGQSLDSFPRFENRRQ